MFSVFILVVLSFVSRSLLVTSLYRVPPYVASPPLRSCFIVLLAVPKSWRLLLLSEGHSVRMCFIVSGVPSPQFSQIGGCSFEIQGPCLSSLWPILNLVKHLSTS